MDIFVHNYESLSEDQKTLVPNDSCDHVKRYIEMNHDLKIPTHNSEVEPQNGSKILITGLNFSPKIILWRSEKTFERLRTLPVKPSSLHDTMNETIVKESAQTDLYDPLSILSPRAPSPTERRAWKNLFNGQAILRYRCLPWPRTTFNNTIHRRIVHWS